MAKRAIKQSEYKQLLNYISNDTMTRPQTLDKYKKIFTFLYYTGARINEACKLKGENIHDIITTRKTKVLTSKTARFKGQGFRTVFFSKEAAANIEKVFQDSLVHLDGFCIRAWNDKTKEVNTTSLTTSINLYLQKALNSKDYGSHSFRRGIITEMIIDESVNPEIVQKFIGHRNYATTSKYVEATDIDIQNSLVR